jgi:Xaa-Pro aminopeptidase
MERARSRLTESPNPESKERSVKHDLDQLMQDREIDAAVVTGGVHNNPSMYYMANGAHLTRGILVKPRGQEPVLIHQSMERDEAAKSGLVTIDLTHFEFRRLIQESADGLEAMVKLYRRIFEELGVTGRVGFYGMVEQGASYALLTTLQEGLADVTVVGEHENDIFDMARATKDPEEIERMRHVGQTTTTVMREMMEFVRDHQVARRVIGGRGVDVLVKNDGTPLTVGDVKRFGRSRLFVYELEDAEGMIFALGADAGVPHSRGEADDPLYLGQTIVFDFFPREMGGGYFHDVTRTFCLGYAPPEVQKVYDDVKSCFERVMAALKPDTAARDYEAMTCDIFEEQGHSTHRLDPANQEGYVHSLGHGVGLKLHERPTFSLSPNNEDVLRAGAVVTIEPGLYYPSRGFGVRIEDTVYLDEQGQFHSLTDFSKELVLEV